MRVRIMQHCDEAMKDALVIEFVTNVYKAAENKTSATHSRKKADGTPWIELRVGEDVRRCSASLHDASGTIGVWNPKKLAFYPPRRREDPHNVGVWHLY